MKRLELPCVDFPGDRLTVVHYPGSKGPLEITINEQIGERGGPVEAVVELTEEDALRLFKFIAEIFDFKQDEIKRLAKLGATLERVLPVAAEEDQGHHANLACRCLGSKCSEGMSWYVYKQSEENEPLKEATVGTTAQEALDNWDK